MVATKLITVEEFEAMGSRADRVELIEGALHDVPASGFNHGSLAGRLSYFLNAVVMPNGLGEVLTADAGFVIGRNPDSVLAPDVSYVSSERIPAVDGMRGFSSIAPDIAIEIESPSNSRQELLRKAAIYLAGGVKQVWLVHPDPRTVTILRHDAGEVTLSDSDTLTGGDVLPGFELPLATLFRQPSK